MVLLSAEDDFFFFAMITIEADVDDDDSFSFFSLMLAFEVEEVGNDTDFLYVEDGLLFDGACSSLVVLEVVDVSADDGLLLVLLGGADILVLLDVVFLLGL